MELQGMILSAVCLPVIAGGLLLAWSVGEKKEKRVAVFAVGTLLLTWIITMLLLCLYAKAGESDVSGHTGAFRIFSLTKELQIRLMLDDLGAFFLLFIPLIWLLGGVFSVEYLRHEHCKKRFWGFYLLTLGALQGLSLSGNLVTMYLFFEMMTLVSMPLVLHTQTHEAIMAGLKYLLYSMCGAYLALFGVFFFGYYGGLADFVPGGNIDPSVWAEHGAMLQLAIFCMILGFGVKAGMFPLHAWLPTAHPVAPAPASAVLSAVIVKGGILAILRSVYYVAGAGFLAGTWVQTTWMVLALITIFMGSMLAFREPLLKKRFAYSSVSQASYILLGMAALNDLALTGALLHVVFHAFIKTALFLTAGAIIYQTGHTKVEKLRGIGKEMPVTIWCYTITALGLIGIPPVCGFISKWYLAVGMLESRWKVFSWLGPVVLLVSALLTAGYLLPIAIEGFLPGKDYDYEHCKKREPSARMTVPLLILAAGALLLGIFPGKLILFLHGIAAVLVP